MAKETLRVLLVDDSTEDVEIVRRMLGKYVRTNIELEWARTTTEGEAMLEEKPIDLILLDYMLPGEDGLSFLQRRQGSPDLPPIIMLSAHGDERIAANAIRWGACDYFPKGGINSEILGHAIHQALEKLRTVLAGRLEFTDPDIEVQTGEGMNRHG